MRELSTKTATMWIVAMPIIFVVSIVGFCLGFFGAEFFHNPPIKDVFGEIIGLATFILMVAILHGIGKLFGRLRRAKIKS